MYMSIPEKPAQQTRQGLLSKSDGPDVHLNLYNITSITRF